MTTTHPIIPALLSLLGPASVIHNPDELICYECDGFTIARNRPLAVVFPTTTQQVADTLKLLHQHHIAVLPRGAGTGLCGGIVSVSEHGSVQVSTARMKTIHTIDLRNRYALVDAGVANLALSAATADSPYHFAPDPSSQLASTIGGNAATNAGGIHTLKHGVTVNHLLGLEIVLSDGSIHTLGSPTGGGHTLGPDLVGLLSGTEGTLALITRVWCRLTPKPTAFRTALAVYDSSRDACNTVAQIIAAGILPAALEMMDGPMIKVVEEAFHFGFPTNAQALLLIEIDGPDLPSLLSPPLQSSHAAPPTSPSSLDLQMSEIAAIARANRARDFQSGSDPQRRADLWSARKKAFGALGRLGYAYCTQDACVPRSKLPDVIDEIAKICRKYNLFITNCFHAGDGNVHPVLCYNESDPEEVQRTLDASGEILRYCISIGGSVTGEHGVGIEKLPYMRDMFSPTDLAAMHTIRSAFSPDDAMNPFKVLPRDHITINLLHPQRHVPQ